MVFITLGEPQVHGDTAEPVPFVQSLFSICLKAKSLTSRISVARLKAVLILDWLGTA